ncbi:hypothetical protein ASG96_18950 [Terrabacter sp. Soil810]|nr:hypothetical protein ASG96_18950 [Terrabacter sp. Soil810]
MKASNSSVSRGLPARQDPTADSLSHTSCRGTARRRSLNNSQCPATKSGAAREATITANSIREWPAAITSTGGRPTCPNPSGMSTGRNHKSHCTRSPATYAVRLAGSGGRNNGHSSRTRSLSTVNDRCQPTRCAITVAGIVGHERNSSMIAGSTASTHEPFPGRSYRGGLSLANARRTAFREIRNRRAIALIGICSARCNRRISAQSSTLITLHRLTERGPFSPVDQGSVFTRRRHRSTPVMGGTAAVLRCCTPRWTHRQSAQHLVADPAARG